MGTVPSNPGPLTVRIPNAPLALLLWQEAIQSDNSVKTVSLTINFINSGVLPKLYYPIYAEWASLTQSQKRVKAHF
jgi:hypothetical protein